MHIVIRKAVAILLSFALVAPLAAEVKREKRRMTLAQLMQEKPPGPSPYAQGYIEGKKIAERRSFSKSGTGLAVGLLSGLIGTGIGYFIIGPDEVPHHLTIQTAHKGAEYQLGFSDAYKKVSKQKKKSSFAKGGIGGTAVFVVVYLIYLNQQDE